MKYDLHAHTFYSNDAIVSPEDLVKTAKARDLDGIVVSDHNTTRGWKRAIVAGKKHGIDVIRGEEVKVFHNGRKIGEVLALFINEEIKPAEFLEVKDRIRQQGGLMSVAHPFDYFRNNFKMTEDYKKHFDAVETMNARVLFNWFNSRALEFARVNKLPVTGGSDSHCKYEIAHAHTEADVPHADGLQKEILRGRTKAHGKRTNPLIHSLSTLTKLGLMRPKGL